MRRIIATIALCSGLVLAVPGCAGVSETPVASLTTAPDEGTAEALITPEPATAPSADRADFASLIWEFSDDGDQASEAELWDLGVTICELFDTGGGFDDVLALTEEQAFSPEFAIAISIASTTYICPEHDARIGRGIDEYLA